MPRFEPALLFVTQLSDHMSGCYARKANTKSQSKNEKEKRETEWKRVGANPQQKKIVSATIVVKTEQNLWNMCVRAMLPRLAGPLTTRASCRKGMKRVLLKVFHNINAPYTRLSEITSPKQRSGYSPLTKTHTISSVVGVPTCLQVPRS